MKNTALSPAFAAWKRKMARGRLRRRPPRQCPSCGQKSTMQLVRSGGYFIATCVLCGHQKPLE